MAIASYTPGDLRRALESIGVHSGQAVVVHSSLVHLGRIENLPARDIPVAVTDTFLDVLGPDGTVAVPASNYDYGLKGLPFDLQNSPVTKDMGILGSYFLTRPGVRRSCNATFSLAVLGKQAEWLCQGGNGHPFGFDSAWDRLFQLDADVVFLGCGVQYLSFTRYMEMRFGVPYLYNKLFSTPVIDHGQPIDTTIVSLLRYRSIPIDYKLDRLEKALREAGALREAALGGSTVKAVSMKACFDVGMRGLKQDIHFFLSRRPDYLLEQIPLV